MTKPEAADLRAPEVEQEVAGIALGAGAQSNACGPKGQQGPSREPLTAQAPEPAGTHPGRFSRPGLQNITQGFSFP